MKIQIESWGGGIVVIIGALELLVEVDDTHAWSLAGRMLAYRRALRC